MPLAQGPDEVDASGEYAASLTALDPQHADSSPEFLTHDPHRLQQVSVVRHDHSHVTRGLERIEQQVRGEVHVAALLLWHPHLGRSRRTSRGMNQPLCLRMLDELAEVEREPGQRVESMEVGILPGALTRPPVRRIEWCSEVPNELNVVARQGDLAQRGKIEPLVGAEVRPVESRVVEVEAIDVHGGARLQLDTLCQGDKSPQMKQKPPGGGFAPRVEHGDSGVIIPS